MKTCSLCKSKVDSIADHVNKMHKETHKSCVVCGLVTKITTSYHDCEKNIKMMEFIKKKKESGEWNGKKRNH